MANRETPKATAANGLWAPMANIRIPSNTTTNTLNNHGAILENRLNAGFSSASPVSRPVRIGAIVSQDFDLRVVSAHELPPTEIPRQHASGQGHVLEFHRPQGLK